MALTIRKRVVMSSDRWNIARIFGQVHRSAHSCRSPYGGVGEAAHIRTKDAGRGNVIATQRLGSSQAMRRTSEFLNRGGGRGQA